MNRAQEVVMAIIKNAADDCRAADFCVPEEVRVVRSLVKRGILQMWATGTRTGEYTDYQATYA